MLSNQVTSGDDVTHPSGGQKEHLTLTSDKMTSNSKPRENSRYRADPQIDRVDEHFEEPEQELVVQL